MNPEIAKLIEELREVCAMEADEIGGYWHSTPKAGNAIDRAAVILQAVFDHENQPSQFGTVLLKDGKPAP